MAVDKNSFNVSFLNLVVVEPPRSALNRMIITSFKIF